MEPKGYGVNTRRTNSDFAQLEFQLSYLKESGFEFLEVSADVADVIANGKIVAPKMARLSRLLERFDFKLTVHIQNSVDFRDAADREYQLRSLSSAVEFTEILGGSLLVTHFERESKDPEQEKLFHDAMYFGLETAKKHRVKIALENIEIDLAEKVADFVDEVNDPDFVFALDVGHAFLSESRFGCDFLETMKRVGPRTKHLHLSDNFGRFDEMRLTNFDLYRVTPYTNRLNSGRGDLNLPPGWGDLPLREVIEALTGYEGIVVLEYYHDKYIGFNKQILEDTKRVIESCSKP